MAQIFQTQHRHLGIGDGIDGIGHRFVGEQAHFAEDRPLTEFGNPRPILIDHRHAAIEDDEQMAAGFVFLENDPVDRDILHLEQHDQIDQGVIIEGFEDIKIP